MTLILAGANTNFAFLASDRRFSYQSGYHDDEKNKVILFVVRDAKLLVAFTGLAEVGSFQTARWLGKALSESAQPDLLLRPTIQRLVNAATAQFQVLPCSGELKRLSIVMVGYWYGERPPYFYWCWISNFERDRGRTLSATAENEFLLEYGLEERPIEREPHFVFVAGTRTAVTTQSLESIAQLLKNKKPPQAAISKAIDVIRAAARSPRSRNTIGEQCNSAFVPRDRGAVLAEYHSAQKSNTIYVPDIVMATGTTNLINRGARIEAFTETGSPRPIVIPGVGRNVPCPCGSGKRYKHCHGKPTNR